MAKLSDELLAMVRIERLLLKLDEQTRARVLAWLHAKYCCPCCETNGKASHE